MTDVINLYTIPDCPKCKILKKKCENSNYIKNSDFKIINILESPTDKELLLEVGCNTVPVMLINDTFFNFSEAMTIIDNHDKEN